MTLATQKVVGNPRRATASLMTPANLARAALRRIERRRKASSRRALRRTRLRFGPVSRQDPRVTSEYELREAIVMACRRLAARGLIGACEGNLSARLGDG